MVGTEDEVDVEVGTEEVVVVLGRELIKRQRLSRSPAPHSSREFPGQVNEQSVTGAATLPTARLFPQ